MTSLLEFSGTLFSLSSQWMVPIPHGSHSARKKQENQIGDATPRFNSFIDGLFSIFSNDSKIFHSPFISPFYSGFPLDFFGLITRRFL